MRFHYLISALLTVALRLVSAPAQANQNPPPSGQPPAAPTPSALRAFFNGVAGGFARIEMKPEQIFIVGNEAAVKWAVRGTGKNGRAVTFEGIDFFAVNDEGKIQTVKAYWDPAAMMAELMR